MNDWMNERMNEWMNERINECVNKWINEWVKKDKQYHIKCLIYVLYMFLL